MMIIELLKKEGGFMNCLGMERRKSLNYTTKDVDLWRISSVEKEGEGDSEEDDEGEIDEEFLENSVGWKEDKEDYQRESQDCD